MIKIITPIIILLSVFSLYLDNSNQLYFSSEYNGIIKTEDGNFITYNVVFSCDFFECNGYSISDENGINETKSILKGSVNKKEGFIELYESSIAYTKADYSSFDEFCYLAFKIPTKSYFNEKPKKITTKYSGYFADKVECSRGSLELVISEDLERQIQKIRNDFLTKTKVKKIIGDSLSLVINQKLDSLEGKIIKRKRSSIFIKEIKRENLNAIYLQDIGRKDGDKIIIQTKNETNLVELTKRLKRLNFKNTNFINIIGADEGKAPTIPISLILDVKEKKSKETIVLRLKDTFKIQLKD